MKRGFVKISLDKIAKKNENISSLKKPWEKVSDENILEGSKVILNKEEKLRVGSRPRFEIPESNKKKLSDISQSLDFLINIVKM